MSNVCLPVSTCIRNQWSEVRGNITRLRNWCSSTPLSERFYSSLSPSQRVLFLSCTFLISTLRWNPGLCSHQCFVEMFLWKLVSRSVIKLFRVFRSCTFVILSNSFSKSLTVLIWKSWFSSGDFFSARKILLLP